MYWHNAKLSSDLSVIDPSATCTGDKARLWCQPVMLSGIRPLDAKRSSEPGVYNAQVPTLLVNSRPGTVLPEKK
jgi:hypothetical protein